MYHFRLESKRVLSANEYQSATQRPFNYTVTVTQAQFEDQFIYLYLNFSHWCKYSASTYYQTFKKTQNVF